MSKMFFHGVRHPNGDVQVFRCYEDNHDRTQLELKPDRSLKVANHSPDGFNWGYGGSGPSQLALALILEATNSAEKALRWYHDLKRTAVAGFGDYWTLPASTIHLCIRKWEIEEALRHLASKQNLTDADIEFFVKSSPLSPLTAGDIQPLEKSLPEFHERLAKTLGITTEEAAK